MHVCVCVWADTCVCVCVCVCACVREGEQIHLSVLKIMEMDFYSKARFDENECMHVHV